MKNQGETTKMEKLEEMKKEFDSFSKQAETFINKWGNPHSVIIIEQGSICFYEGVVANPLKLED